MKTTTADYIRKGLEEEGHSVVLCGDGGEGLRLGVGGQWDVIILDRMLPGDVDGLSILKSVRDAGKATPVLILSALASLDERVRGLRDGGDDYLTKPFAFSELMARVEALTRRTLQHNEQGPNSGSPTCAWISSNGRSSVPASRSRSGRVSSVCWSSWCATRAR